MTATWLSFGRSNSCLGALLTAVGFVVAFSAVPAFTWADGSIYNASNIALSDGTVQAGRSGTPIFFDRFESSDVWPTINNYQNLLDVEFNKEYDGVNSLVITRSKPLDEGVEFPRDTAISVSTDVRPFEKDCSGREYVLRFESIASKQIVGSAQGPTYSSLVRWFDSNNEEISSQTFSFLADLSSGQKVVSGRIPDGTVGYEIQLGFDVPNIEQGEFAVVRCVSLEIVDPEKSYISPGEFVSNIFEGGKITWDADVPDGAGVSFQISTASVLPDSEEPGKFSEFVGPDGTPNSRFTSPFEVSAPFVRYKAFLIPNGKASPTLKNVFIGQKNDSSWRNGGDIDPPRVKLAGVYAEPSEDRHASLEFDISDDSYVRSSSIVVTVDEEDVTSIFERGKTASGALHLSGRLNEEFVKGLHKATVEVADVLGNSVLATRYFLIGKAPSTPKITLREDGATLIDGTPFFPIGIYGVTEREFNGNNIDEAFRGLKEAGFNFAHSYSMPREDKFLQAAEKYGFKLWSVARFPDERFVEVERHCPAIIAWYLGDDTSYNTKPSELYDYFDSCKAVDPTRLTVQADPIDAGKEISNYRPYVKGTDAFLPEIYPVRKEGVEGGTHCVAQTIMDVKRSFADARDANDGPKAIWPIIQYFQGWGWERFPTYQELRAMSFAALAAGTNGITWYTYGGFVDPEKKMFNYGVTTTPERWKNISTIATQINELSPVLLQLTDSEQQPKTTILSGPKQDPEGNDSITCLLKVHEEKTVLLAVNSSPKPVDVQFEFPTRQDGSKFEVLFDENESAAPTFKNGVLRDCFEGFGVRIYRW
ncbi:MAG: hypothetical protein IKX88_07915 [Thermoguttaceae bacterium]|nr:hypothetical protein [Thermoguttaceae bacterium]